MKTAEAEKAGYRIERASPIEWGLLKGKQGVCTWWYSTLGLNPTLDHPKVQEAIKVNEQLEKDFPGMTKK